MKEKFTCYLIKCDGCGQYLENEEELRLVSESNEIKDHCDCYDWEDNGDTHYCPECIENRTKNESRN